MNDARLQKFNAKELLALRERIDVLVRSKQQDERRAVRQKLEDLARKHGFKASELFGRATNGSKLAPKYRNPKNPSETWTGRGRKPRWMAAAGGNASRFLIK